MDTLTIADVLAALTASLGEPGVQGEFKGKPCASWGACMYAGTGVDCYVAEATGAVCIALYTAYRGTRTMIVSELRGGPAFPVGLHEYDELDSAEAVLTRKSGRRFPVIVPLAVAVDCAARTMVKP